MVAARVVAVARDEGGEGDREDVTACATSGAPAPRARPPPPVRRSRRFVRSVGGAEQEHDGVESASGDDAFGFPAADRMPSDSQVLLSTPL